MSARASRMRTALVALACCAALAASAHAQPRPDAGAPAATAPLAVSAALARLDQARASVQTIEAEFDQERVMGLFAQTVRANGRLVVQRPGSVRWEIVAPAPGVFIVAGGRVAYRAGNSSANANQSQVGPLGAVLGDLATFLGGSLASLQQRYQLEAASRVRDNAIVLTAVPHDPSVARVVNRVVLTFRPDGRAVEQIEMFEPGGDHTRITTRATRINTRVTPAMFQVNAGGAPAAAPSRP